MMAPSENEYDHIVIVNEERLPFEKEENEIVGPIKAPITKRSLCGYGITRIRQGINMHRSQSVPENDYSGYREGWKGVYEIIYESSTTKGQAFDIVLLTLISISVFAAVLDSVKSVREEYGSALLCIELIFTFIFSVEYILRVVSILQPREYICSVIGIIDLSSIFPTYLAAFIPSARPLVHLAVLRVLRVLRVFRVLKLVRFVDEAQALCNSMKMNQRRVAVFLFSAFTLIIVIGCAMYLIEGETHGFSSIPMSLYWTVVTLTTVGYGDITPITVLGRVVATFVMLAGYGIIACPLVLVNQLPKEDLGNMKCIRCHRKNHPADAVFCRLCGTALFSGSASKYNRDYNINNINEEGDIEETKLLAIDGRHKSKEHVACA